MFLTRIEVLMTVNLHPALVLKNPYISYNTLEKTVVIGAAFFCCFGLQIAVITMVANLFFFYLIPSCRDNSWFSFQHSYKHKTSLDNQHWLLLMYVRFVIVFLTAYFRPTAFGQHIIPLILSLTNPFHQVILLLDICIIGPILEEIIFRGFIQEKIRDIQSIVSNGKQEQKHQKIFRIAIQAIIFGLFHYHPKNKGNFSIILTTVAMGCFFGVAKEKTQDLWSCILR